MKFIIHRHITKFITMLLWTYHGGHYEVLSVSYVLHYEVHVLMF